MAEITLTINGRDYGIACDDGQEQRVIDLGHYVDARLRDVSGVGAATNESHLLVLTAIMLADEVFDLRDEIGALGGQVEEGASFREEEALVVQAIDHLADRIGMIAERVQGA